MTLWELARNQKAVVDRFSTSMDPKYAQRLEDLGLREGEEIHCLRRSLLGGPRVYQVGSNFIALEKMLAICIPIKKAS